MSVCVCKICGTALLAGWLGAASNRGVRHRHRWAMLLSTCIGAMSPSNVATGVCCKRATTVHTGANDIPTEEKGRRVADAQVPSPPCTLGFELPIGWLLLHDRDVSHLRSALFSQRALYPVS